MIMVKISRTFCSDKLNNFASYISPDLVLQFYAIVFTKKYWYWILILQYFLDTDTGTALVFLRLSTDTDTSVF